MKTKLNFYLFIAALTILDAVLIRSPNLVGKIGLLIYKYHYLRTFPKALMTVSIIVGVSICITEVIHFALKKNVIRRAIATILMVLLSVASLVLLVKTGLDFSKGMYSHTGLRFRSGAYLLPAILLVIYIYGWITLPKPFVPFPESPTNSDLETGQIPDKK
jgi:hypothetical protein